MALDWFWVLVIQVFSGLLCYLLVRSAAKMRAQRLGFALPLTLSTPIAYVVLAAMCGAWNSKPCAYAPGMPGYLFFKWVYRLQAVDSK
jgi:hypothetical protein